MPEPEAGARARPPLVTPAFALITLTSFCYFASVGVVIPVLPVYVRNALASGSLAVGLAVGAFSISAIFVRPLAGAIGDRHGRRVLILSGTAIVVVSVIGYVPANSLAAIVAFRLLSGVGEALFFVGATTAINDLAPDERRGEAISLFTISLYGGLAVGPLVGEAVLGETRFDAVWLVSAALAGIGVLLSFFITETRPLEAGASGRRRLIHPAALLPGTVLLTSVWGFAAFLAFIALYAREDLGLSGAGLVLASYSTILLGIRGFGARLPDRFGLHQTARASLLISALGLGLLGGWQTVPGMFAGASVLAVGQSLGFPALMAIAANSAPPSERGSALGTFSAFFDIAFGIGAVSLGAIATALDYGGTFMVAGGVAFLGFLIMVRAVRVQGGETVPAVEPL